MIRIGCSGATTPARLVAANRCPLGDAGQALASNRPGSVLPVEAWELLATAIRPSGALAVIDGFGPPPSTGTPRSDEVIAIVACGL